VGTVLQYLEQEPLRFLLSFGAVLFLVLNLAAVLTMAERKVSGYIQLRYGPNRVGPRGLLQPAADVFKLFTKENVSPGRSDLWVFLAAPIAMFLPAAAVWLVIPFAPGAVIANINVGILFFIAVTSIGALGVVMAGYGSRSTFSLLGALRGAAQMISYEVPLILSLLGVVMLSGSLSFVDVVNAQGDTFWTWYFLPLFPMFITFYVAGIAEVKRVPFDLPEGESEIVGGFMIASMGLMSAVTTTLFLGGWQPPLEFLDLGAFNWIWFGFKTALIMFTFQWIRWSIPRLRMDQLMDLGWKVLVPLTLIYLFIVAAAMLIFQEVI
jgi:NADH-quinone oxidoreductase subunit H